MNYIIFKLEALITFWAAQVILVVKNLCANVGDARDMGSIPEKKIPWRRKWQPTPVFQPGKFHGLRSLMGCSPGGHKESYITEQTYRITFYCGQVYDYFLLMFQ